MFIISSVWNTGWKWGKVSEKANSLFETPVENEGKCAKEQNMVLWMSKGGTDTRISAQISLIIDLKRKKVTYLFIWQG